MISFVYFDVGGVAILDFSGTNKWTELKQELGITPEKDIEFEQFWKKYEAEVCVGRNVESLLPLIKHQFGSKLPESYSLLIDGFVKRFEVNKSIWPVIEKIHQKCKIGLLTGQYPGMLDAIKKKGILPDVDWDVVIDSSIEGVTKPDKRIFELAESRSGFKGKDILFIENSPKHIEAAQKFGWFTFLYDPSTPEKSSQELLKRYGHLLR